MPQNTVYPECWVPTVSLTDYSTISSREPGKSEDEHNLSWLENYFLATLLLNSLSIKLLKEQLYSDF
jgi:hypothetical protein